MGQAKQRGSKEQRVSQAKVKQEIFIAEQMEKRLEEERIEQEKIKNMPDEERENYIDNLRSKRRKQLNKSLHVAQLAMMIGISSLTLK